MREDIVGWDEDREEEESEFGDVPGARRDEVFHDGGRKLERMKHFLVSQVIRVGKDNEMSWIRGY